MKKIIRILILLALIISIFLIIRALSFTYITAKFEHLRPIYGALDVYYKGIIIGKARELKHSDNYNHTLMKIVLFPKNLHLPSNTTILLKKEKRNDQQRDFLELEYPKEPNNELLSNNSTIEGIATVDTETYLQNQKPNEIEEIKENLIQSVENLNEMLSLLNQVFGLIHEILDENKSNFYKTTKTIENMTIKMDKVLNYQKLDNTVSNIENTTAYTSKTIDELNKTIPNIDNAIKNLEQTACNTNKITCAIRKTLSKNFGGLRIFFGKTIE
jgi:ABC-type transporter Mla subunit MlaD